MTVNPGWGGQSFIAEVLDKITRRPQGDRRARRCTVEIEVDGGINVETAPRAARAGADILVAGSAVFGAADPAAAARAIRAAAWPESAAS